jgi:hypothetical protein
MYIQYTFAKVEVHRLFTSSKYFFSKVIFQLCPKKSYPDDSEVMNNQVSNMLGLGKNI